LYRCAAIICFLTLLAHEVLGAPMVLKPLAESALDEEIILLHHFSWHVGSIAIIAMIFMYTYASLKQGNVVLAIIATAMSLGFALLGIGLAVYGSEVIWGTPAPYVWSLVTLVGAVGIWLSIER
jgi:hypothetical protein